MISAVLLDFGGVVATMRMAFQGEEVDGDYVAEVAPGVVDAIAALRSAGLKVALVSNNDRDSFAGHFPTLPLSEWFDAVVFSSDVGADKPRPPIYLEALRLVDVDADAAILFDDLPRNVDAAIDLGMQGVVITSIDQTVPELHKLLVVPPPR